MDAQRAIKELSSKLIENSHVSRAATRANEFMETARSSVESAIASLKNSAPASTSEALAQATKAVDSLKTEVSKLPSRFYSHAEDAVSKAKKALLDASIAVATWQKSAVAFALRRLSDFDSHFEVSRRGLQLADSATEAGKMIESRYNIAETVKGLDTKWALSATVLAVAKKAKTLGDSITGSRVTPAVDYLSSKAIESYNTGVQNLQHVRSCIEANALEQAGAEALPLRVRKIS